MATVEKVFQLGNGSERAILSAEESARQANIENKECRGKDEETMKTWGFRINELYRLALLFYKEHEGKAMHVSYADKLTLVALTCQVRKGPCHQAGIPSLGVFDVIGRDRRLAWQALGSLPRDEAMLSFVKLLEKLCPLFRPSVEAHKRSTEQRNKMHFKVKEQEEGMDEEARRKRNEEQETQELKRRKVQQVLNQLTYHQFRCYAEQHYPGNPEQQAVLVRDLQQQHYQKYMQQLCGQLDGEPGAEAAGLPTSGEELDEVEDTTLTSMWTRTDIEDFKASVCDEGGACMVQVAHGETISVRVPSPGDGACLFWEFATDRYDIGFGLIFEWAKSSEEEEVVPVYRRDCQQEVYAGRHVCPGPGVHILKFDNSYSLWRAKTLYYRVYYTH